MAVAVFANRFMLIPWYAKQMGMGALAEAMQPLFPPAPKKRFTIFICGFPLRRLTRCVA